MATDPERREVGIFTTQEAACYVEPSDVIKAAIEREARMRGVIPFALLSQLVVLKILAPQESARVRIYPHTEAVKMLERIRSKLIHHYYAAQFHRERS